MKYDLEVWLKARHGDLNNFILSKMALKISRKCKCKVFDICTMENMTYMVGGIAQIPSNSEVKQSMLTAILKIFQSVHNLRLQRVILN